MKPVLAQGASSEVRPTTHFHAESGSSEEASRVAQPPPRRQRSLHMFPFLVLPAARALEVPEAEEEKI